MPPHLESTRPSADLVTSAVPLSTLLLLRSDAGTPGSRVRDSTAEEGGEGRGGERGVEGWGRVKMEIPSPQIPFREALHIFKVSIVFVS